MFQLVAHFKGSLGGQCLVAWPEDGSVRFDTKIDTFDIKAQLISTSGSRWKKSDELYSTSGYDQVLLQVAGEEPEEPPRAMPDDKGRIDYTKNIEFYGERAEKYRDAARSCVNRLIRFFKYRLKTPFLKELPPFDNSFVIEQWTDQLGHVLHKGPYIYTVKMTPGLWGGIGVGKLDPSSIPLLQQAIIQPIQPELYEQVLSDAQTAIFEDNLRRAVLELAIACEIATKNCLFPAGSPAGAAFEYLEDKAQIRTNVLNLLDAVALEAFNKSFKRDQPEKYDSIDYLFQCRNKVVHRGNLTFRDKRGEKVSVNKTLVIHWWEAAETLFHWLKGLV